MEGWYNVKLRNLRFSAMLDVSWLSYRAKLRHLAGTERLAWSAKEASLQDQFFGYIVSGPPRGPADLWVTGTILCYPGVPRIGGRDPL